MNDEKGKRDYISSIQHAKEHGEFWVINRLYENGMPLSEIGKLLDMDFEDLKKRMVKYLMWEEVPLEEIQKRMDKINKE